MSPEEAMAQLARVLASQPFTRARVLQRFLRFLIEWTLQGRADELKEYVVGVDAFNRGSSFDPRIDTIVRVQARRLRARLEEYYQGPGRADRIVIGLPKGSYAVTLRAVPAKESGGSATDHLSVLPSTGPAMVAGLSRALRLPAARTALIAREQESLAVRNMLLRHDVRLLTLTGAGGSGKTRLAIQVAREADRDFAGGVYFVALGAVTEAHVAVREIAVALGLRQTDGRPLMESLQEHLLRSIRAPTLLVVDNFEQLTASAPLLVALLDICAALKILVTSRALLRVSAAINFNVLPLSAPAPSDCRSSEMLSGNPAVALFVQRATAIEPAFVLTDENAAAIAEICVRLDGLPLALELAAARINVLTPAEMCARLTSRLDLLTLGAADLPERQRTLRQTLEWSHALLTPAEQRLFCRLAVFSGGCTLESAAAVCNARGDLGVTVLDGMSCLLDQHLVYQRAGTGCERRFTMLETVHEFAQEQLDATGEGDVARHAHAAWCLLLAEDIASRQTPAEITAWMARCAAERDNHHAALRYLIETKNTAWALRLGVALYRYWERGSLGEGRAWLEAILELPRDAVDPLARATALSYAASMAANQGDFDVAGHHSREDLH